MNSSLPLLPRYSLTPLPPVIPGVADPILALALPVVAYWVVSLVFHAIDMWDLFPQYRLHTPAEVLKRNHVSRWEVLRDVVVQQIIQTAVGLALTYTESELMTGDEDYRVAVWAQRIRKSEQLIPGLLGFFGVDAAGLAEKVGSEALSGALKGGVYSDQLDFAVWELVAAGFIYHWVITFFQFLLAMMIVDTWQYFLHRLMHTNKYLYTRFHSRHHRLYVPYAYGALYNHPFEGFLLDTLGTGIAFLVSGMTVRQSMWFFTLSTIKTVDDHCGYRFPLDPLQHFTSNNAAYHDVHHQSWGIKTNFSQPFFTFWDKALGTKWAGGDVSVRYERSRIAAQKQLDAETLAIKASPYVSEAAHASSTAFAAQAVAEPSIPRGLPALQALAGRQQVLDDREGGGITALAEESAEEIRAKCNVKSPKKSIGLKDFVGRVSVGDGSAHGKNNVLGLDGR
ncbi:C4-hydroxylase [Piedraia hortae CBS 480.64]|uniref:C4-hydroxylase n=1 Tax=Piedraia hortae CBS 480.64 TaxID=1314780 RepID=A0A6A7C0G5_9PEZI|nr:C4-hydroxylase [Piedraia hortae CBS 480.64]